MAKLNTRFLIHGSNADRVLFFAVATAPQITPITLAGLCVCHLVDFDATALDTRWRIAPALLFKELDRRQFV